MEMHEEDTRIAMIAVVQATDCDLLETTLNNLNLPYSRLPSVGGFLREHNVTFLIACEQSRQELVREMLVSTCKKRTAFIATPIENIPIPIPYTTETIVGGISLFSLDLEHLEEI